MWRELTIMPRNIAIPSVLINMRRSGVSPYETQIDSPPLQLPTIFCSTIEHIQHLWPHLKLSINQCHSTRRNENLDY